jgi:SAM-dependent methyltransferase
MTAKQTLLKLLRAAGLLAAAEYLRSCWIYVLTYTARKAFESQHPEFPIPPWNIAYDAYGGFFPEIYLNRGIAHADRISGIIKTYHPAVRNICDWGCGPMRVLRHIPSRLAENVGIYGFDYNPTTIAWAKQHFPAITFRLNNLEPPLPADAEAFDVVYCLSVFTHLSQEVFLAYVDDIYRILAPGGIFIFTTHGPNNAGGLLRDERQHLNEGQYICRGNVKEGSRTFISYQSPDYIRAALHRYRVLDYLPRPFRPRCFARLVGR